jgi:hypothetical protein
MDYYLFSPLCVSIIDVNTKQNKKSYFFLGNVPNAILAAAKRVKLEDKNLEWTKTDITTLKSYYGHEWKEKLTPPKIKQTSTNIYAQKLASGLQFTGGDEYEEYLPIYSNIAVYPEDTIYELKLKISIVSNIAFYRQHLLYFVNEEGPVIPYRFLVDNSSILIDFTNMKQLLLSSENVMAGLTIDTRLEERKEGITIEALDTFNKLSSAEGVFVNEVYIIDLFDVIKPLTEYERPNDNLNNILNDKYQFDLFYYGGIIKYWPHLSLEACRIALSEPDDVAEYFPELDLDIKKIKEMFDLENIYSEKANNWRSSIKQNIAITQSTITINPMAIKLKVNIRNIFDWIPLDKNIVASSVKFETKTDNINLISSNEYKEIDITKRHISTYKEPLITIINRFVNKKLKKKSIMFALCYNNVKFDIDALSLKNKYQQMIYLEIDENGFIQVISNWREDNRLEFNSVSEEVYKTISPLLKKINEMNAAAFPIGGNLFDSLKNQNVISSFGTITVSTYWPQIVSTAGFKIIKSKFREYEKAGIINVKGLQHGGAYSFMFKKGITNYERSDEKQSNQYSWMVDSSLKQKWESNYQGRLIKIYHRVSDLKIEINDAYNINEFHIIQKYILSFLDSMVSGADKIDFNVSENKDVDTSNTLKRLQERDPNLFDLKKYNQKSVVYSVLCQSGRQPIIYDEEEINEMKDSRKKKMVKYWNFTDNEPAYYECPDKEYSHLSFRSGQHSLGYCLPCCKKSKPVPFSKAEKTNKECLDKKSIQNEKEDLESRHILTYGKEISPDRLSLLPSELSDGLFLNCIALPFKLYVIGVEQSTPAVSDAGFMFAMAYTIASEGKTQLDMIEEIAKYASEMKEIYFILGNGYASLFASSEDLAEEIRSVFIRKDDKLSPFGAGGALEKHWKNIITDIVRYFYGIEIVVFSGPEGNISIEFRLETKSSLLENADINTRLSLFISNEFGFYPICALNQKQYLKTQKQDRWMIIRNNFGDDSRILEENKDFIVDTVFITICNILNYNTEKSNELDLMTITEYSNSKKSLFKLKARFINLNNLCYGVLFNNDVYIPIKQSKYPLSEIELIFGNSQVKPTKEDLYAVVDDINIFLKKKKGFTIEKNKLLTNDEGIIGFIYLGTENLYFYHLTVHIPYDTKDNVHIPYDTKDIDRKIMKYLRNTKLVQIDEKANRAFVKNNLYKLFLAEFISILKMNKNISLRSEIIDIIKNTNFNSPKSTSVFRYEITKLLQNYPEDLRTVRNIVSQSYLFSSKNSVNISIDMINSTNFVFDNQLLIKLRNLSHENIISSLKNLMSKYIEVKNDIVNIDNIYVACSDNSSVSNNTCHNGKLIIPSNKIDEYYDILASDILNPYKTELDILCVSGTFDELNFIKRPNENIQFME